MLVYKHSDHHVGLIISLTRYAKIRLRKSPVERLSTAAAPVMWAKAMKRKTKDKMPFIIARVEVIVEVLSRVSMDAARIYIVGEFDC